MKQKIIQVYILKIFYPRWGSHTAFNSFLSYFDQSIFKMTMKNVPMGGDKFVQVTLSRFIVNGLMRKIYPQNPGLKRKKSRLKLAD